MITDYARRIEAPALELRVGFLLMPDFTLMALTGFVEALRVAGDEFDRSRNLQCQWEVMAPTLASIRSSCGLSVLPTSKLRTPETFDYIVVVGGLLDAHERIDPVILEYLRKAAAVNIPLIGACTGSFVLARAGLMEGRRCCVHQFHANEFPSEFPTLTIESDRLFVVDGPRITCPGGASASDVAIHLIQRHCGRDRALKTVSLLLFDEARSANHPQARTALDLSAPVRDPLVRRALLLMQQNVSKLVSIENIASALGTNVKKLARAFEDQVGMPPGHTYRHIRLERSLWLIEHSRKNMSEIAYECGFADASHFSRTFRQVFGSSPRAVRAQLTPQNPVPISETQTFMRSLMPEEF